MGTTALGQLLERLCKNSEWTYAVFWKLKHRSRMLLTWEDGYCDYPKLGEPVACLSNDFYFSGKTMTYSPKHNTSIQEGSSINFPIGVAVADMSYLQYALGEGVVGKVASTGKHCWCFSDKILAGEFNSKLITECPDEWLLQFLGGIKTILLVPVVPHGVLQLGSLETVAEDLALVAYIKDSFHAHENELSPFTSNRSFVAQTSPLLIPDLGGNLDGPPVITNIIPNKHQHGSLLARDNVELSNNKFSSLQSSRKDLSDIIKEESANEIDISSMGFIKVEEPQAFFQCNDYNVGLFSELSDGVMNSGDIMEPLSGNIDAFDVSHTTVSSISSFPLDSELQRVLGPAFNRQTNEYPWDSTITGEDASISASLLLNGNFTDCIEPSSWEFSEWSAKDDTENLLEAVVAGVYSGLNDILSEKSDYVRSFETSVEGFETPLQAQNQSEKYASLGDDSVGWSHMASSSVGGARNATSNSPTLASSSFKSMMSGLIDEEFGYVQPRKEVKSCKVSKRRARSGVNQKPRPRDRQMIQDRVKELRDLVPNGAKCSIDGLLDRTINHMLFLRSITDRAEKFRQWMHHEVADHKSKKLSEAKGVDQNGASWAFQLGNELEMCPIVVKDLEYPGHMLIEMVCSEHGLFLEIAQVIRGLELTIMEGVIESRSGSTWARFIVEVSPGFHRMDIFWPLMHLLQKNRHPISSRI